MHAQRAAWPDRIRPLRRIEYESLVEQGLLDDSRVELLLGALVDMRPQALYASAEIPEFWLVNLTENNVEVHRQPTAGRYAAVQCVDAGGSLSPVAFPTVRISVAAILT